MKATLPLLALAGLLSLSAGIWYLWLPKLERVQRVLELQPDAARGKDAVIWNYLPDQSYPYHPQLLASAWTFQEQPTIMRSLFSFDLSALGRDARIEKASLQLHHHVANRNPGHNGLNQALISRIIEPWEEQDVTWNTQPATTPLHQVSLPLSEHGEQDYTVDVTALMQDALQHSDQSFGFMLQLSNETHYRSMVFASSDAADAGLRPALTITYTTRQ
ncbi:DNRLRE domain-containing protein [Cesiribacter andamanensis]|uniref:Disaggregatase related repeat protein n=1 Tax=Cesiribacter andamanensis AMV16 TaxID=1279009 RepID=M7N8C1_9BACT|nr:DNRLRE domain-containing protein [Cesiribacter andamanensis]EMR03512.1 Disaggregatase related repeat protein [Cesiribacter andamanensis AMV16]